jgi:hypothetical protein
VGEVLAQFPHALGRTGKSVLNQHPHLISLKEEGLRPFYHRISIRHPTDLLKEKFSFQDINRLNVLI